MMHQEKCRSREVTDVPPNLPFTDVGKDTASHLWQKWILFFNIAVLFSKIKCTDQNVTRSVSPTEDIPASIVVRPIMIKVPQTWFKALMFSYCFWHFLVVNLICLTWSFSISFEDIYTYIYIYIKLACDLSYTVYRSYLKNKN